jgi:hypothetical protein
VTHLVTDVIKRREGGVEGLDVKGIRLDYSESLVPPGCCYQVVHCLQDSKKAHVERLLPDVDYPPLVQATRNELDKWMLTDGNAGRTFKTLFEDGAPISQAWLVCIRFNKNGVKYPGRKVGLLNANHIWSIIVDCNQGKANGRCCSMTFHIQSVYPYNTVLCSSLQKRLQQR